MRKDFQRAWNRILAAWSHLFYVASGIRVRFTGVCIRHTSSLHTQLCDLSSPLSTLNGLTAQGQPKKRPTGHGLPSGLLFLPASCWGSSWGSEDSDHRQMLGLPHLRWWPCCRDAFSVGVLLRNAIWTSTPLSGTQSSGERSWGRRDEAGQLQASAHRDQYGRGARDHSALDTGGGASTQPAAALPLETEAFFCIWRTWQEWLEYSSNSPGWVGERKKQ